MAKDKETKVDVTLLASPDPYQIPKPDPDMSYVWVDPETPDGVLGYLYRGFSFVEDPEEVRRIFGRAGEFIASTMQAANGRVRVRRSYLMKVPKELREAEWERDRRAFLDQMQSLEDAYMARMDPLRRRGVSPLIQDPQEFSDEAAFNKRPDRPFAGQVGGMRDSGEGE